MRILRRHSHSASSSCRASGLYEPGTPMRTLVKVVVLLLVVVVVVLVLVVLVTVVVVVVVVVVAVTVTVVLVLLVRDLLALVGKSTLVHQSPIHPLNSALCVPCVQYSCITVTVTVCMDATYHLY